MSMALVYLESTRQFAGLIEFRICFGITIGGMYFLFNFPALYPDGEWCV
jgi:hypothetical protein